MDVVGWCEVALVGCCHVVAINSEGAGCLLLARARDAAAAAAASDAVT